MNPFIIGVAGGSCSGKTTFCRRFIDHFGEDKCNVLYQDNYYIDQSHKFDKDGGAVNFDHPAALDFSLMAEHLRELKQGNSIKVPVYDFATHTRKSESVQFNPNSIVLVDGILVLGQLELVALFDTSIYIECDTKTRFDRRMKRDVAERGRTPEGVSAQFENQVEPMHQEFVRPSRKNAEYIVPQSELLSDMDAVIKKIAQKAGAR